MGGGGKPRGPRERAWLRTPRPVRPLAGTASPSVRARRFGVWWGAGARTSPPPRASNLPATRPRWAKTCRRDPGCSGLIRSAPGEERVPPLHAHPPPCLTWPRAVRKVGYIGAAFSRLSLSVGSGGAADAVGSRLHAVVRQQRVTLCWRELLIGAAKA